MKKKKTEEMEKVGNVRGEILINSLSWQPQKEGRLILDGIDCVFEQGNIYGIIGPNGSGKTSLIRNILRFIVAGEGNIQLEKKDIREYRRKDLARKIALVPQNTAQDSEFCAYDMVMMGRAPHQKRFDGISERDREKVDQAMSLTGCLHLKDKKVSTLSGGEAQHIATARAIAQDTEWLILDEPTSSLDVRHQMSLMESLSLLNTEQGKTILTVLHDINMAASYCSHIVMMKDGKIFCSGRTHDVMTQENLSKVYEVEFEVLANPVSGKKYFIPNNGGTGV